MCASEGEERAGSVDAVDMTDCILCGLDKGGFFFGNRRSKEGEGRKEKKKKEGS